MKRLAQIVCVGLLTGVPLAAQRSDAAIQKCIANRIDHTKLKDDGITATVSHGNATLTGSTKLPGRKARAATIAEACGASRVTNNITVTGKLAPDQLNRYRSKGGAQ